MKRETKPCPHCQRKIPINVKMCSSCAEKLRLIRKMQRMIREKAEKQRKEELQKWGNL